MSAATLLDRLDGVKNTGPSKWLAKCPAHEDRSPSLSVRELDDGRVLVHDFAGCGVEDVLAAVGLDWGAIMPERAIDHRVRRERQSFSAIDVLRCLRHEVNIATIVVADVLDGKAVSEIDRERFRLAVSRINEAAELANA